MTATGAPSPWVERHLSAVPARGQVLDVACGSGRHLRLCLEAGLRCLGVDRDLSGARSLAPHPRLELVESDLETGSAPPFAGERFEGVIVTNYLWRPLLPVIVAAVADDGVLIYETFAVGNEQLGRPRNPDFLLRPNELLEAVIPRLTVVAFEETRLGEPDRVVQRIVALGPHHAWHDPHLVRPR
jgi:SAM-dependent methyltransferase